MDFHLLEAQKPRSATKQQLKGAFVGRDPENAGISGRAFGWRRRVTQILKELGMGKKYGERYDPYATYRRQLFDIFIQMETQHGVDYMHRISNEQYRKAIRQWANELSRKIDMPHKDMRGSSITRGDFPGALTQQAGYVNADGETVLGAKGGVGSSGSFNRATQGDKVRTLSLDAMSQHENPRVKTLHAVLHRDKPGFQVDSAAVLSADSKPFYLFGKVTKTVKAIQNTPGTFNLFIPRALDYSHGKGLPELKDTIDKNWWNNWRAEYRSENLAKLTNNGQQVVLKGKLGDVVLEAQKMAWKKAEPYYALRVSYKETVKKLDKLTKKYLRQNYTASYSEEDAPVIEYLGSWKRVLENAAKGRQISYADKLLTKENAKQLKEITKNAHESLTWLLWLHACEDQFGVLLPERQRLPENADKPRVTAGTQPKPEHSVIQLVGREEEPTWNLQVLRGVGFRANEMQRFETALQKAKYKFGNQGNKAITHIWVPLVDLDKYERGLGMNFLPKNVSDYLRSSKKITRTEYILGREGDDIDVKVGMPIPQYKFTHNGIAFSLIPAAEYLRFFDSPKHGGDRLVHGVGVVPGKLPTRTHYEREFLNRHPNFTPRKGVYIHDPGVRQADVLKMERNLQVSRFKSERQRVMGQAERNKQIAARKGLHYIPSGTRTFTGFAGYGTKPRFTGTMARRGHYTLPIRVGGQPVNVAAGTVNQQRNQSRARFNFTSTSIGGSWKAKAMTLMDYSKVPKNVQRRALRELLRADNLERDFFDTGTKKTKANIAKYNKSRLKREQELNQMSREEFRAEVERAVARSFI